jgi:hypothetical protein
LTFDIVNSTKTKYRKPSATDLLSNKTRRKQKKQ